MPPNTRILPTVDVLGQEPRIERRCAAPPALWSPVLLGFDVKVT
jgi:hypothetical protein